MGFQKLYLDIIAFTCKPEIQFIPLKSVRSRESVRCRFYFYLCILINSKEEHDPHLRTHIHLHLQNSLYRLKQHKLSSKVALCKKHQQGRNLAHPMYLKTFFPPMLGPSLAGMQGSLALLQRGAASTDQDFGENKGAFYWS